MQKKKTINDPVFGFITFESDLVLHLINHPYFQRLRRIKQLGLTEFVYPSAVHTRFHHALGATYLMGLALETIKSKGVPVNDEEYEASLAAILLHDIGHGPLSHTLENTLLDEVQHEKLSLMIMNRINLEMNGRLDLAIKIFTGEYERKFFHQLVSGHFDMDRMDYLKRDSFYTGVSEGNVGVKRIISMINVEDDQLVIEEKGIFNVENLLMARRFMYWQVYLHKTTVATEKMIDNLFARARQLYNSGNDIKVASNLEFFVKERVSLEEFNSRGELLKAFLSLDDSDIWTALKNWVDSDDLLLSNLSRWILERKLFTIKMSAKPVDQDKIDAIARKVREKFNLKENEAQYLYSAGSLFNTAYGGHGSISILTKNGVVSLEDISDVPTVSKLGKIVRKYYLCYPKNVSL